MTFFFLDLKDEFRRREDSFGSRCEIELLLLRLPLSTSAYDRARVRGAGVVRGEGAVLPPIPLEKFSFSFALELEPLKEDCFFPSEGLPEFSVRGEVNDPVEFFLFRSAGFTDDSSNSLALEGRTLLLLELMYHIHTGF